MKTTILAQGEKLTLADLYALQEFADAYKKELQNAIEMLGRLRLEAIHFRNTKIGEQFLNAAIKDAEKIIDRFYTK